MKEYTSIAIRRFENDLERLNAKAKEGWRVICCVPEDDENYNPALILEREVSKRKVKP